MTHISASHYQKMKNSFRLDVARFLTAIATEGRTVTYGELSENFSVATRGWGNILGGIAIRCHEANLPLLSVIVVSSRSKTPSEDALIYRQLGLTSPELIAEEQARCFQFDWSKTPLGTAS
jgi:hypothetical protein